MNRRPIQILANKPIPFTALHGPIPKVWLNVDTIDAIIKALGKDSVIFLDEFPMKPKETSKSVQYIHPAKQITEFEVKIDEKIEEAVEETVEFVETIIEKEVVVEAAPEPEASVTKEVVVEEEKVEKKRGRKPGPKKKSEPETTEAVVESTPEPEAVIEEEVKVDEISE